MEVSTLSMICEDNLVEQKHLQLQKMIGKKIYTN